jgi:aconitate hydratase
VDHNLLQTEFENADDHIVLQSASKKYGYWYSRPGNGISHPVHMERFGIPGKTLLGSDSHTCSGGGVGMLAIGTGGLDVAMASAGEPFYTKMPKVLGVKLTGTLPPWVSAKDIVLEMLRKYDVKGCRGFIIEYYGEGLKTLSAWDRHVIANMGTEMGATATVFPSDDKTRLFLRQEGREEDWIELKADSTDEYDKNDEIVLNDLVPLIAYPTSPGNVVPVSEVEGKEISQVVVGSSANPGLRDFWVVAEMLTGRTIHENISMDINPSSRQIFQNLIHMGSMNDLLDAGARFHQTGCMGCIGMGQAPASGEISLRTMPRNFPGRSGTMDDKVYLCSPETAAASALTGKITDPRNMEDIFGIQYPDWREPEKIVRNTQMLIPPGSDGQVKLKKGENVKSIPDFPALEDNLEIPVILKMGDNISTDEILKAGADVLPLRSNIEELSKYAFWVIDKSFYNRASDVLPKGHIVVAGENYAQGSSREHAALCPKFLGQKAVISKNYSRIGWQNLVNFGIIPFEFVNPEEYDLVDQEDMIRIENIRRSIGQGSNVEAEIVSKDKKIELTYTLSDRQKDILLEGGLINYLKKKKENTQI